MGRLSIDQLIEDNMIVNKVVCDGCGKEKNLINKPYVNAHGKKDEWQTLHKEGNRFSDNLVNDKHFCSSGCIISYLDQVSADK
jgi:hypothetical protein